MNQIEINQMLLQSTQSQYIIAKLFATSAVNGFDYFFTSVSSAKTLLRVRGTSPSE
jgi:hypothetical protein